ncbi:hypothetical protein FH972_012927 [Carpinus fangiana]|uniref:glucan endo-1,3-beta-D-glucosidase n=1 Tax=Carpinus fangiana TaxID=176857 RepID=A0A5N6R6U8_9ROSI|nr:hypothetical protein FH972_012927 [Carpinus fangiana]
MASDPKVHVFEEVAKHNSTKDCWLIIYGKELSNSRNLRELNLTGNDVVGRIPDLSQLRNLEILDLSFNYFSALPGSFPNTLHLILDVRTNVMWVQSHQNSPSFAEVLPCGVEGCERLDNTHCCHKVSSYLFGLVYMKDIYIHLCIFMGKLVFWYAITCKKPLVAFELAWINALGILIERAINMVGKIASRKLPCFDTLVWALRKNGYGKMRIVVGEIGWPSNGDQNANLLCARLFNQGFKSHVKSEIPMTFALLTEAYMSSSFNEDAKNIDPGKFERH